MSGPDGSDPVWSGPVAVGSASERSGDGPWCDGARSTRARGPPLTAAARAPRALLAEQAAILERAAGGAALAGLLDDLCRMIEGAGDDTVCTVLLLEGDILRHGAAPGMPEEFTAAIDGEHIGPGRGSCGTAAHLAEPVVVDDIEHDPKWAEWRDLALGFGFRACWSVPVLDETGTVLATFAAYSPASRLPTANELELLELAAHLTAILVGQHRSREQLRAMATRLARLNSELVVASQAKDDFLSMTSHELRTPLTPMLGMLETLQRSWDRLDDTRRRDLVDVVSRHTGRMVRLVDDLLTMASVGAGQLATESREVELAAAVNEAIVGLFAEDRTILCDVPRGLAASVDPNQLQQILMNLLTNAVKYAPGGPIRVTAVARGAVVDVRVLDEGPGIEPDFVPDLFEPFHQADYGDRRTARGTGLGLSVVRVLAAVNHGTAWYEPREPAGSCFVVALPRATRG